MTNFDKLSIAVYSRDYQDVAAEGTGASSSKDVYGTSIELVVFVEKFDCENE